MGPTRKAKQRGLDSITSSRRNYQSNIEIPQDCTICLDKIECRGIISVCPHWFCFYCILEWSKKTNTCPMCKARFRCITKVTLGNSFILPQKFRIKDKEQSIIEIHDDDYAVAMGLVQESESSADDTLDETFRPTSHLSIYNRLRLRQRNGSATISTRSNSNHLLQQSTEDSEFQMLPYNIQTYQTQNSNTNSINLQASSIEENNIESSEKENNEKEDCEKEDNVEEEKVKTLTHAQQTGSNSRKKRKRKRQSLLYRSPLVQKKQKKKMLQQGVGCWIDMSFKSKNSSLQNRSTLSTRHSLESSQSGCSSSYSSRNDLHRGAKTKGLKRIKQHTAGLNDLSVLYSEHIHTKKKRKCFIESDNEEIDHCMSRKQIESEDESFIPEEYNKRGEQNYSKFHNENKSETTDQDDTESESIYECQTFVSNTKRKARKKIKNYDDSYFDDDNSEPEPEILNIRPKRKCQSTSNYIPKNYFESESEPEYQKENESERKSEEKNENESESEDQNESENVDQNDSESEPEPADQNKDETKYQIKVKNTKNNKKKLSGNLHIEENTPVLISRPKREENISTYFIDNDDDVSCSLDFDNDPKYENKSKVSHGKNLLKDITTTPDNVRDRRNHRRSSSVITLMTPKEILKKTNRNINILNGASPIIDTSLNLSKDFDIMIDDISWVNEEISPCILSQRSRICTNGKLSSPSTIVSYSKFNKHRRDSLTNRNASQNYKSFVVYNNNNGNSSSSSSTLTKPLHNTTVAPTLIKISPNTTAIKRSSDKTPPKKYTFRSLTRTFKYASPSLSWPTPLADIGNVSSDFIATTPERYL